RLPRGGGEDRLPRAGRPDDAASVQQHDVDVPPSLERAERGQAMTITPPKVAILAGGFGTRLGALTEDLPKPMIEIGGRPFLERAHAGPTLAVYPRRTVGNVLLDGERVLRFDKRDRTLPYIDAGFSLMPASTIDLLPRAGACSFEEIVYATLAKRGELRALVV